MVNQVVWPYRTGEVIVQNYNAVLTLSHLYQTADAIVVMENDELHRICSQLLGIKVSRSHYVTEVCIVSTVAPASWVFLGEIYVDVLMIKTLQILINIDTWSVSAVDFISFYKV